MSTTSPAATDGASGFVRALIAAGCRATRGPEGWAAAVTAIPARPAVVALEDEAGNTVLLGTTADARAFVTNRCITPPEGKRADLGGVTAGAVVTPVASGFEADLVYLAMARERTPAAYKKLMARWGLWVVRLDAADAFPEPVALRIEDAGGMQPGTLLGPVTEQWGSRLGEAVVDAFDLCRYPNILKQAPRGVACAYKEMGRCPAPCDGTEALELYRVRVRVAAESVGAPAAERGAGLALEMKRAAQEARFEDASVLKKVLDRVQSLDSSGLRGVMTMDRFRHVVAAAGAKRGEARLYGWIGGRLVRVADVTPKDEAEISAVINETLAGNVEMAASEEEMEGVSVLVRWAGKSAGKKRVRVVRLGGADVQEVSTAVSAVARAVHKEELVEEVEHGSGDGGLCLPSQ